MNDFLATLLNLAVVLFAATSMASIGFRYSIQELLEPLREVSWVIRALVANFILVPLLTFLLLSVVPLDLSLKIGFFLVTCAAGAPFTLKFVQAARGNLALSGTLVVLLLLVTMVYMPVVVPMILPEANVSAAAIATPLLVTMLLPLAIGLFVAAQYPVWATRLQPITNQISSVALVVLIAATVLLHFQSILFVFSMGTVLISILIIGGSFGLGFLFGGPDPDARSVLGLGTAQRNIAAATVVATQGFETPGVLVMVVLFSLLTFAILFPLTTLLRRITGGSDVLSV